MQCDNCGYIFFKPSKKCACCSAPYAPGQSAFDVGQEHLFTIFEMAPGEGGIPGGMGMSGTSAGVEDYNFTDDFGVGETEYGVDENVLDLSDAEAEGFGIAPGAMGADDFEFDTSGIQEDTPSEENSEPDNNEAASTETVKPEAADDAVDIDFDSGFDEVEGLGFGLDESPAAEAPEVNTEEISLDDSSEPEISLEPELDIDDEEPSLELPEDLDLSEEPELMDASEEPELMDVPVEESATMEDDGAIEFDLDSVDLDEPEEVAYEVPEAETGDEETSMDFEELEMEIPDDDPEDEELTK